MSDPHTRIAELEAELAAVRRELQEFTSAVSHDLRAPLRHIVSFAQLVEEDAGPQLSAEVQGFLSTITGSAKHLGAMLDGLRELSRVGSLVLAPVPVDLRALVQEVALEVAHQHAPRQLALDVDVPDAVVVVDVALLRVVLRAVFDNAWKFTSRVPEAEALVVVRAWQAAGRLVLEVQDNGAGCVSAHPEQALRMFGRLHAVNAFPGLGVGLALAAKAAQRMGAALQLAPAQPVGCVVTLSLPLAAP